MFEHGQRGRPRSRVLELGIGVETRPDSSGRGVFGRRRAYCLVPAVRDYRELGVGYAAAVPAVVAKEEARPHSTALYDGPTS